MSKKGIRAVIPGLIKVQSADLDEHQKLLRALTGFGCGHYRGKLQLAPVSRKRTAKGAGVTVSIKGVIEIVSTQTEFDHLTKHRELPAQVILLAPSRKDLVTLVWGSTAWNLLDAANTQRDLVARVGRTQNL